MKLMRILPLLVVTLALVAAGCGGGDDGGGDEAATTAETTEQTTGETTGAEDTGAGGTKTVDMTEYEFDPSDVTASRGDTINVVNKGNVAHNLTIEEGPDPKEKTKKLAGTSSFLGGKSERLTVDVAPGKHAMVCTVPGHRELGMTGTFTVK